MGQKNNPDINHLTQHVGRMKTSDFIIENCETCKLKKKTKKKSRPERLLDQGI